MNNNIFLYTLPQWFIFSGLLVMIYGWFEKKKAFKIIGFSILIALAIFSVYAILAGFFDAHKFLTPDEIVNEQINGELTEEVPFEGQIFPAYLSFIVSGIIAIPGIFFEIKNKKQAKLFMIITGLIALFGFFVIVDALKVM